MHLHRVVQQSAQRKQNHSTFFFRNRAELELLTHLVDREEHGATVKIAVLGCSKGAEVYSIVGALRGARPDLKLNVHAVDISEDILEFAKEGIYALPNTRTGDTAADERVAWNTVRDQMKVSIFERVTPLEMRVMFERQGDRAKVKAWLKKGIFWHRGSAEDPELLTVLGPQDVVVANRFLCHMETPAAERCLRAVARLVKPGGYLFATGVDLDVREKIAREMGWKPVTTMMQEVHEGDRSLSDGWPTEYWALEPFRAKRRDWKTRYSSVFRLGVQACFVCADLVF